MMDTHRHNSKPKLYSIPPAAPFLSTLADALLTGNLIEGFKADADPLALSTVTIYVPTRRAARALQAEFVARAKTNAQLLPKILPLGDIEEDEFIFEQQSDNALELDPTIGSLERQLLLTRMIERWSNVLESSSVKLFGEEALAVPASITDAAWLANDLASLMDTVATEEADWALLDNLVPGDYADWWNLTLGFLQIATKAWPLILQERKAMDVASRRGLLLHRQAAHYKQHGSKGPVIAAGSTGSIPATAALLGTIAQMENGAVILPGLDRDIKDDVWQKLVQTATAASGPEKRLSHAQSAAPAHPQYGLKKLLDGIGVERDQVTHIGGIDDSSIGFDRLRETIVSLSMEPSETTDNWPEFRNSFDPKKSVIAFSGVTLIEAEGERQEALAIALAMREVLEENGKTGALVTPDRVLARRVSVELRRFGIDIDDSAGIPLSETLQGSFTRIVLSVALAPADPVALLTLIKHPLASFGLDRENLSSASAIFEIAAIRGNISTLEPGGYFAGVQAVKEIQEGDDPRRSSAIKKINEDDWQKALVLAEKMDTSLAPLHAMLESAEPVALNKITKTAIETLEAVARDEEGSESRLYEGEAGDALSKFLGDLLVKSAREETGIELHASEWPSLYDALLGSRPVRPHRKTHSRLSIWGPLEARLQQVDCIILGSLNEGTWPAATRNDPFINRPMKSALSLEPPERRIGLAAHDFQMLMGSKEVILTRSLRADNAPTVASRWVQRLLTLAGENTATAMRHSGQKYLDWGNQIDRRALPATERPVAISRPEPKPAPDIRPHRISITEVETWIRDPYAIYAKHVLKLEPQEQIKREVDARERGNLYHAIFEQLCLIWSQIENKEFLEEAIRIAETEFARFKIPTETYAFWWPRFVEIAEEFIQWETGRRDVLSHSDVEKRASLEVGENGFTIRGVADRIDRLNSGAHVILDYKTGISPSVKQAKSLISPQLPLEGAMALRGAFEGIEVNSIEDLIYVRLRSSGGFKIESLDDPKADMDANQLSENAWAALNKLVSAYENPDKGYLSRARSFTQRDRSGDFDHLARVMEWSLEDGEIDE